MLSDLRRRTFQSLQQILRYIPANGLKIRKLKEVWSLQTPLHLIAPNTSSHNWATTRTQLRNQYADVKNTKVLENVVNVTCISAKCIGQLLRDTIKTNRSNITILISEEWKHSLTWAACLCWGCGGSSHRKPCNPERWELRGSILQERVKSVSTADRQMQTHSDIWLNCSCPFLANSKPFISGVRQSWSERPISQNPLMCPSQKFKLY